MLTVVILAGYGGYSAWNAVTGDDPVAAAPTGNGFAASAERAAQSGHAAIFVGVGLRILKDGVHFVNAMDDAIARVQTERANFVRIAARATGAKADIVQSAIQTTDSLEAGIVQWRDGIVNLRLAGVDEAESAILAAIAQLEDDITRWSSLTR